MTFIDDISVHPEEILKYINNEYRYSTYSYKSSHNLYYVKLNVESGHCKPIIIVILYYFVSRQPVVA
jgi:hypothetical protein